MHNGPANHASRFQTAPLGSQPVPGGAQNGNGHPELGPRGPEAFAHLSEQIAEFKEYASYYAMAKLDAVKVSLRNVGIYIGLGIVGLIASVAIIITSVWLLLDGLAVGIGNAFGTPWNWLGGVIIGLVMLIGIGLGIVFTMKSLTKSFRWQTIEKYEARQREQNVKFGHNVRQAAHAPDGK